MTEDTDALFGDGAEPEAENSTEPTPILTDAEIEEARKIARDRVAKALKDAEKERIIREEMEKFRREEGKRTGAVDKDELVNVTIDCAEFADRLCINGQEYFHGYTYEVPRHVYDTLRDIMFRGHLHQSTLDGKDLATFYGRKQSPTLSGKAVA